MTRTDLAAPFGPLLVWLCLQLLALLLAALQVPLSANWPDPGERLALQEMLLVQIAGAALLFPYLLREAQTALLAIVSTVPFVTLASNLSAQLDPRKLAACCLAVALWLGGLACWRPWLDSAKKRLTAVALAVTLALGGPALTYLNAEFRAPPSESAATDSLGPVSAAWALATSDPLRAAPWVLLGSHAAIGGAAFILLHRRRRGEKQK